MDIACRGTGLAEQSGEAELVEGVQAEALGADGAGVVVVEGIEADGDRAVVGVALEGEAAGAETADEVLGGSEDLVGDSEERGLSAQDIVGEAGDVGPEGARDGIVGAEVEEGFLLDRGAGADGLDEAEAAAGLAADGVGFGSADEHGGGAYAEGGRGGREQSRINCNLFNYLALHRARQLIIQ